MQIIETMQALKDWFLFEATINETMLGNELCRQMYEAALKDPSFINIKRFWVFSGMDRFHHVAIGWEAIYSDLTSRGAV